ESDGSFELRGESLSHKGGGFYVLIFISIVYPFYYLKQLSKFPRGVYCSRFYEFKGNAMHEV
ncbi:MAG: hypothetical protein Q8P56_06165, partial [Candidatus Uhrbacteria bacterium]|nr:hypothetical protein [Candidatus Uhrbacteria bacterium]